MCACANVLFDVSLQNQTTLADEVESQIIMPLESMQVIAGKKLTASKPEAIKHYQRLSQAHESFLAARSVCEKDLAKNAQEGQAINSERSSIKKFLKSVKATNSKSEESREELEKSMVRLQSLEEGRLTSLSTSMRCFIDLQVHVRHLPQRLIFMPASPFVRRT